MCSVDCGIAVLSKAATWFARETNAIPAKGSGS
jgi:hypothetical protein